MIAIGSGLTIGQLLEQQIAAAKATQNSLAMKMVSENGRSKQEKTFEQAIREAAGTEDVTLTEAAQTKPVSLEDMLKKKYPNLVYNVLDASSPDWRRRNDYPHYLLYQENLTEEQISQIENWKPSGANPFYGSKDGQFIAPKEIKALQSVPPGSKAVVIHPKVQEKMEQDPAYAEEIYQRIEAWWAFDTARNEAMMPGITARSSMCVAIGEDGLICNAQSHSQGRMTQSSSRSDDSDRNVLSWWDARMERHDYYMQLWQQQQMEHSMEVSGQFASLNFGQSAKATVMQMLGDENLKAILGDTIGGASIEDVFESTREHVFNSQPKYPLSFL